MRKCVPPQTKPQKLEIKRDSKGMVIVPGATVIPVLSARELLSTIEKGQLRRHTGETQMNRESSRSHLIMSIIIESTNLQTQSVTRGKLSFVDLAGSERWAPSLPSALPDSTFEACLQRLAVIEVSSGVVACFLAGFLAVVSLQEKGHNGRKALQIDLLRLDYSLCVCLGYTLQTPADADCEDSYASLTHSIQALPTECQVLMCDTIGFDGTG